MKTAVAAVALLAVLMAAPVQAIDRGASMIDSLVFDVADIDGADSLGFGLWNETALENQDWALLFGGTYGEIGPEVGDDINYWSLGLGIRYYITSMTAADVLAQYGQKDQGEERDIKSATLSLRQRLMPAGASVSPFLRGSVGVRERSTFSDDANDDNLSEVIGALSAGVEFRLNSELSFSLEAGYQEAEASDDGTEDLDGTFGSVAMRYYFDVPVR